MKTWKWIVLSIGIICGLFAIYNGIVLKRTLDALDMDALEMETENEDPISQIFAAIFGAILGPTLSIGIGVAIVQRYLQLILIFGIISIVCILVVLLSKRE